MSGTFRAISMELAEEFGIKEALIIGHIEYWMREGKEEYREDDGYMWFHSSIPNMIKKGKLPISKGMGKRILSKLQIEGVICRVKLKGNTYNSYRINYEHPSITNVYDIPPNTYKIPEKPVQKQPNQRAKNSPVRAKNSPLRSKNSPVPGQEQPTLYINNKKTKIKQKENRALSLSQGQKNSSQGQTKKEDALTKTLNLFATNSVEEAERYVRKLPNKDRIWVWEKLSNEQHNILYNTNLEEQSAEAEQEQQEALDALEHFGNFNYKTRTIIKQVNLSESELSDIWRTSLIILRSAEFKQRTNRAFLEGIFRNKLLDSRKSA